MGMFIFCAVFGTLFLLACLIGVMAMYFYVKGWIYDVMGIELPPKAKAQESYWETTMDSVTPTYACHSCNRESELRYKYCPWCGKKMDNYNLRR